MMLLDIFRAYDVLMQDDQYMPGDTVTDEMKSIIDTELDKYPKLKELVNNSEKKYVIYAPYPYGSEYSEIEKKINSTKDEREEICKRLLEYETDSESLPQLLEHVLELAPWFVSSKALIQLFPSSIDNVLREKICEIIRNPPLKSFKVRTSRPALGGVLWSSARCNIVERNGSADKLKQVNNFLTKYPKLLEWNYGDKIYSEFSSMCAEMKIYDQLKQLGFDPDHEPLVQGTDSKPDFSINFNGMTYFIEVKFRFESFYELLDCEPSIRNLPANIQYIHDSTRKTTNVVVTTILDQIKKWESVAIETPVILVIETTYDFFVFSLNVDIANLPQMIYESSKGSYSNIPQNLKGILLFNCNSEQSPNGVFYSLNNCDDGFTKKISSVLPWIKIFR